MRNLWKNKYTMISIGAILVMALITAGSLLFFKTQIMETVKEDTLDTTKQYEHYFAMITSDSNSSFWKSVLAGAKQEAEETGNYLEVIGADLGDQYTEQEKMRIAIESGVDGIIVEADDSTSMRDLINEASDAGIPVVTAFGDCAGSIRKSYVGINSFNLGREYGRQVNEIADNVFLTEKSKNGDIPGLRVLVLFNQKADDSGQNIVFSGIQEAVMTQSKYADRITLEAKAINADGPFAAEESIRNVFMTESTTPDIIICLNELNTTCVYQTVVDRNLVGKINIIGYYNSQTILKGVERNVIYSTISVDTEQMGSLCVEALNEYIGSGYVSEYYSVDTNLITADNVKEYLGGEVDEK